MNEMKEKRNIVRTIKEAKKVPRTKEIKNRKIY